MADLSKYQYQVLLLVEFYPRTKNTKYKTKLLFNDRPTILEQRHSVPLIYGMLKLRHGKDGSTVVCEVAKTLPIVSIPIGQLAG